MWRLDPIDERFYLRMRFDEPLLQRLERDRVFPPRSQHHSFPGSSRFARFDLPIQFLGDHRVAGPGGQFGHREQLGLRHMRDPCDRPRDLAELELAYGIGPAKAERYGAGLPAPCVPCARAER